MIILLLELSSDGNLLTHFLYSPLEAICAICSVTIVPQEAWIKSQELLDRILDKLAQLCGSCHSLGMWLCHLMQEVVCIATHAHFRLQNSAVHG